MKLSLRIANIVAKAQSVWDTISSSFLWVLTAFKEVSMSLSSHGAGLPLTPRYIKVILSIASTASKYTPGYSMLVLIAFKQAFAESACVMAPATVWFNDVSRSSKINKWIE